MKGWMMTGSLLFPDGPRMLLSRETILQHKTFKPKEWAISVNLFCDCLSTTSSGLRKTLPVAYYYKSIRERKGSAKYLSFFRNGNIMISQKILFKK